MAPESDQVVLLSIHPRYAEAILAGRKQVEFRRTSFSRSPGMVALYATDPVKRVVGFFTIQETQVWSPPTIWRKFGDRGGIERVEFLTYFAGAERAVAIVVQDAWRLRKPLHLSRLAPAARAPQSFLYLNGTTTATLKRLAGAHAPSSMK